jgi:hypothetical protein
MELSITVPNIAEIIERMRAVPKGAQIAISRAALLGVKTRKDHDKAISDHNSRRTAGKDPGTSRRDLHRSE